MKELLVLLKKAQMYAHHAHNLCARPPFFSDHDAFASFYGELDSDYDSLIERILGVEGESAELSLKSIISQALEGMPEQIGIEENREFFVTLLSMEMDICSKVETLCAEKGLSQGQIQLVGDIANRSEMRQYKIKQRIK